MHGGISWSIEEIFNRSIQQEEQARNIYVLASKRVTSSSSKDLLLKLAAEEGNHKEWLLNAKRGKILLGNGSDKVINLKVVDYLEDVTLSEDSDFQKILIYAGKKEKASHEYYKGLEKRFRGTDVGELFSQLAKEELSHKFKVERIYDDEILKEE